MKDIESSAFSRRELMQRVFAMGKEALIENEAELALVGLVYCMASSGVLTYRIFDALAQTSEAKESIPEVLLSERNTPTIYVDFAIEVFGAACITAATAGTKLRKSRQKEVISSSSSADERS